MSNNQKLSKSFNKVWKKKLDSNKTFRNSFYKCHYSKNISRLRTSHSMDLINFDNFISNSIYQNNLFKRQKLKNTLLNKRFVPKSKNKLNRNIYKDYLHQKIVQNFSKLNNNSSYINNNIKNNINSNINNESSDTNINKNFNSLISRKINDEIYNQLSIIDINENYDTGLKKYKNYTIRKSLLKHFLHKEKESYNIKLEEYLKYIKYKEKLIKLSNYCSDINTEIKYGLYLDFLKEKIQKLKIDNYKIIKNKENIIKEIKIILENLKEKSEFLCESIKFRNLLICLRENIQIDHLPEILTFCNKKNIDNYLDSIDNNLENYNALPNNLYNYLKSFVDEGELNNKNKSKFMKYLDKKPIFSNIEEFYSKYKEYQFKILQNTENYLNIFNNINIYKRQMIYIKSSSKARKYFLLKERALTDKIKELKNYNKELNNKYIFFNKNNNEKNNNNIQIRKIENYTREITRERPIEESKFFFKFTSLVKSQKFKIEYAYVYYMISQMVLNFYKIFPNFFDSQNNFDVKKFNESINNIYDCDKIRDEIIKSNVLYLLSLYETSLIYFFQRHNKMLNKLKNNNEIIIIKRQILTNKNYELIKFQKVLEEYLNNRTKINIFSKYEKINLIKRNNLPNYSKINKNK